MPSEDKTEAKDDMTNFATEALPQGESVVERHVPGFPNRGLRRIASFSAVAGTAETAAFVRKQREITTAEDQRERDAKAG